MDSSKNPADHFLLVADSLRSEISRGERSTAEQTNSECRIFLEIRKRAFSSVIASLSISVPDRKSNPDLNHQLGLLTTFVQGAEVSERLISTGQYAKAAAVLKQDYELLCRLGEISSKVAKEGKTPNAKYGPHQSQHIYGALNSAAHPSHISVLMNNLHSEVLTNGDRTLSPIPVFRKEVIVNTCWLNAWIALEAARAAAMYAWELHGDVPEIDDALAWFENVSTSAEGTGYFDIMNE